MISGILVAPPAIAQDVPGGVNLPGDPSWYPGENLKQGDLFSYSVCHVYYKDCKEFQIDFWFKGEKVVESETKWLVETVVYDGNKTIKGEMELGKIAPEPSGGTEQLGVYRSVFGNSIVWLSGFATGCENCQNEGPKKFSAKSWGKIGNIGGEQVVPYAVEKISVPAGEFETVSISWKTGGYRSNVWVVDDFPFPVKAFTYTHVEEGIPPTEYKFSLLKYSQNVNEPFKNIVGDKPVLPDPACPKTDNLSKSVKRTTKNFTYQIHAFYAPEFPVEGCPMKWQINFLNKFDDTEFLNQVQFDLYAVDDGLTLPPLRSIAQDQGYPFLYSQSGQSKFEFDVKQPPGVAHYVVWVYGLGPLMTTATTNPDFLIIDISIAAKNNNVEHDVTTILIPSWIKNNAGWWHDGQISDNDFVEGIQYMIRENIIQIPSTSQEGTSQIIPQWIKNNAGWWHDGQISDNDFVEGIQFLIKEGIIVIS